MHKTLITCDPIRDAAVHGAIDAQLARLEATTRNTNVPFGSLQVDALVAAVSSDQPGQARIPEVSVLIDRHTACTDATPTRSAKPRPAPHCLSRLCNACAATPRSSGSRSATNGEVLDVGREQRTANRAQRRALRAMYRTCAHPHCQVSFDRCRIHHIIGWLDRRANRPRQPAPTVRTASSHGPRRQLAPHHDPRPGLHLDQTRRNHLEPVPEHQPHQTATTPYLSRNRSTRDGARGGISTTQPLLASRPASRPPPHQPNDRHPPLGGPLARPAPRRPQYSVSAGATRTHPRLGAVATARVRRRAGAGRRAPVTRVLRAPRRSPCGGQADGRRVRRRASVRQSDGHARGAGAIRFECRRPHPSRRTSRQPPSWAGWSWYSRSQRANRPTSAGRPTWR